MRVAYAGYDFFSSCLQLLFTRNDVEVVLCMTGSTSESTARIVELAESHRVPVLFGRPTDSVISLINELRIDLVVVAAYSFRFPVEKLETARAINVHPSLLPMGRGPNPIPYFVEEDRKKYCGVTIHQMSERFDDGPIICQVPVVPEQAISGFDEIALDLFSAAPVLLDQVLDDFEGYWSRQSSQGDGEYWPAHSTDDRTLTAEEASVAEVRSLMRKFGSLGIILQLESSAQIEGRCSVATTVVHSFEPGSIVGGSRSTRLVALRDGIVRVEIQ